MIRYLTSYIESGIRSSDIRDGTWKSNLCKNSGISTLYNNYKSNFVLRFKKESRFKEVKVGN